MSVGMRLEFDDGRFNELIQKRLKIKAPLLIEEMAMNVIGNVAAEGRKKEQQTSTSLKLGAFQHTVRRRKGGTVEVIDGVNLRMTKAGFVSTRFNTSTGPFRMASFSWELARKPKTKQAGYTNQLANLWHRPSKPYRWQSPEVGQPGNLMSWGVGARRPVRYSWANVARQLEASRPKAVDMTSKKYAREFEKLWQKP